MTAVAEPKKKTAKRKTVVSDNTISAVARLDHPGWDDLSDKEVLDKIDGPRRAPKKTAPPAKPGDADFDWSREYPGEDFYVFTAADGTTVALAAAAGDRKLKPGDFRKMSHMEPWAQNFYLIEKVASPAALVISDNLDDEDYAAMMAGWTEWSGTTAGES